MGRVRFETRREGQAGWVESRLPKRPPPAGYTSNTVITEWLTVNCRGDWASVATRRDVRIRFADARDRARALAHFSDAHT